MANAISNMLAHCVAGMSSSLSIHDTVIERRPYHKNCECALHKLKGNCSHIWSAQTNVSFSKKRISGSLAMAVSSSSLIHSQSSSVHVESSSGIKEDSELGRENRGELSLGGC
ncbi:unnamed protein product [Linum tenue]|uniref:Uncharacterized protein n=2 Tax=Linum tenue TaxID=586396 RepID=A0AAV0HUX6_9ROSI|nr:unnamed protein product [Linum tenue]